MLLQCCWKKAQKWLIVVVVVGRSGQGIRLCHHHWSMMTKGKERSEEIKQVQGGFFFKAQRQGSWNLQVHLHQLWQLLL